MEREREEGQQTTQCFRQLVIFESDNKNLSINVRNVSETNKKKIYIFSGDLSS